MAKPERWNAPFGPDMTDADVDALRKRKPFSDMDADRFPPSTPLSGVLKNDTRIVRFHAGDIVVREGDYGNSAFLVLSGELRVVLAPGLPKDMLGRQDTKKKGFFQSLTQLWTNSHIPEIRDTARYRNPELRSRGDAAETRVFLQDIPTLLDRFKSALLGEGSLFGELAALGRLPRTATVFAETDATLLEIRWQGLREFRRCDEGFRNQVFEVYRENALKVHLSETELFSNLAPDALQEVADSVVFETYGAFDWHASYQKLRSQGKSLASHEPRIANQGDYLNDIVLIRTGFTRVSQELGNGERTVTYLGAGDHFGLAELYHSWRDGGDDVGQDHC